MMIKCFDQSGNWIAGEEIAEEKRNGPRGDNGEHYLRNDAKPRRREDVHVENQNRRFGEP